MKVRKHTRVLTGLFLLLALLHQPCPQAGQLPQALDLFIGQIAALGLAASQQTRNEISIEIIGLGPLTQHLIHRILGTGATERAVRIAWSVMRAEAPPSILDECARPGGRGVTVSLDGCSRSPKGKMSLRPRPESISYLYLTMKGVSFGMMPLHA